ncbi:MAG: penicillin-binding protein 1A [Selenomonadaceae bacterium]|nr:penicillin-binding protein 1A [Selenomonadaceae bacterium]
MADTSGGGRRRKKSNAAGVIKRILLIVFIFVLVMTVGVIGGFLTASMNTKPDLANDIRPPATSTIYDINGSEIATVHAEEDRIPVKIAKVPKYLQDAFVAVEDNRFYDHNGVDIKGILRAAWSNIRGGGVSEGGSTITQQLAKNAYLTQDRTLKRKIQEVFLALQLEKQYTKQEILELYLNQIYFGQGAYGVQAAARVYFNKNVEDLTLNECAMLAGIPKSPNYYSPFNNLEAAQERKGIVLDQMVKYGYVNRQEAAKLKTEPLALVRSKKADNSSDNYFINYVTQLLIEKYGADAVYKEGLKIYTTIDPDMQKAAEAAMKLLPRFRTDANGIDQPQGALVAIDPKTGYIKAMIGGRGTDQFNRATMAVRQPGSAFKPFVFAAALENNYMPSTVIDDSPVKIGDWSPQNYDRTFRGKVSLRLTAELSLNVPTVKIAQKLGMDKPIYYAQEMGITTFVLDGAQNDRNLATALGGLTKGVTPLELTSAYGTFANRGVHVAPIAIIRVLDRNGKIIDEAEPKPKTVISEESAAELTSMLMGVIDRGTGTRAKIGRPAAGKTGTTSDYHDAWFVGYTPDLVAGVWIGQDNNVSLGGMGGGNQPAEIWASFMKKALETTPAHNFHGVTVERRGKVGEIKDDNKKGDNKKKETDKNKKTGGQNQSNNENTPPSRDNNVEDEAEREPSGNVSAETPALPAPAPTPTPTPTPEPPGNAPTPGGGVSKSE